jgi:hypothetical protein
MAWTSISNGAVAVGGIPSSSLVTALRDNPGAMGAAESGAPCVFAGWHPYNKVSVGDGQTGLIYDFAVNGLQAEIVTPDFVDGYEYRLIGSALSHNSGASTTLELELYQETSASYDSVLLMGAADTSGILWHFDMEILTPRLVARTHFVVSRARALNNESETDYQSSATEQKMTRARLKFQAGSIDSGKVWMLRRAEYLTGL